LHIITGHVAANTQPQQTVSNLLNLASTNQRFHQIVRNSQLVQPALTLLNAERQIAREFERRRQECADARAECESDREFDW
jgi:hypothetical protein